MLSQANSSATCSRSSRHRNTRPRGSFVTGALVAAVEARGPTGCDARGAKREVRRGGLLARAEPANLRRTKRRRGSVYCRLANFHRSSRKECGVGGTLSLIACNVWCPITPPLPSPPRPTLITDCLLCRYSACGFIKRLRAVQISRT